MCIRDRINDIIEPVSFECGNKLTDYVEDGHRIDIFGDDYPIRNAMLLLLYASFNKIRDFPKLLKNNDNSISPSLFLEFLAPILSKWQPATTDIESMLSGKFSDSFSNTYTTPSTW